MQLTHEQKEIVEAVKECDSLKIFAYAGTGKTTTLKAIANAYPEKKMLYLAFNKSIATEAKEKFPENTEVRTTHSLALKHYLSYAYKKGLGFPELKELTPIELIDYLMIEEKIIATLEKEEMRIPDEWRIRSTAFLLAKLIKEIFDLYCYSDIEEIDKNLIKQFIYRNEGLEALYEDIKNKDILYISQILYIIEFSLKELMDKMEKHLIPISHNFYLKFFEKNLGKLFHINEYDIVLLDEAQDTNDVTLSIFNKIPAKKIMVGDVHQKIYGFRKSINAMEKWNAEKTLRLTISFRFPSEIAEKANKVIIGLKSEVAPLVSFQDDVDKTDIKDICFISRTNSTLIEIADRLLEEGKVFKFIRKPREVFKLPLSILYFQYYLQGFENKEKIMERFLLKFKSFTELERYAENTDDKELKSAIKIVQEYDRRLETIYDEVSKMQRKRNVNIFLTTAHSSKGLEWDKVIILNDFPDFINEIGQHYSNLNDLFEAYRDGVPKAVSLVEELNLYYVAITRAKKVLIDNTISKDIVEEGREVFDSLLLKKFKEILQFSF